MNVQELRKLGREKLKLYNVEDMPLKVDILLEYILNMDKIELLMQLNKEIDKTIEEKFLKYISDIIDGKPVQYITHNQEFMKLKFYVDENVLIPQPDTEILVEEAMKKAQDILKIKNNIKILDLCTGSGAITIALEHQLKNSIDFTNVKLEIYASDISEKAIEIAKKNAKINNSSINFIISDMFKNININDFDMIISNPPYIEKETISKLSKEVKHEPHIALDGGIDGLDFYKIISSDAYKYLNKDGHVLMEIGYNQKEKVIDLFKEKKNYINITCVKDLGGNDRVIEVSVKER